VVITKIVSAVRFVLRARKDWRKPPRAKALVFDRNGSEDLLDYIDAAHAVVLDVRGESINMHVLLRCIFSLKVSLQYYISEFVRSVDPLVAITFIDNDRRFYNLKRAHSALITAFVQNGWRGELGDVFGQLKSDPAAKNYAVDYMLTFGIVSGEHYRKYVHGQVIPIGSLKNNRRHVRSAAEPGTLVFISQYRPHAATPDAVWLMDGDVVIRSRDFYAAERVLLPFLARYCAENRLALRICGFEREAHGPEYAFYRSILGEGEWRFIPRADSYGNYEIIDTAGIVVFVDTTLGYEALARGKKCAAFSIRGESLQNAAAGFGWPAALPDSGPFWTNRADDREFKRVLDHLTTCGDAEWQETYERYVRELIEFDPGNTRLVGLLKRLGVPLNENVCDCVR
jgi:surface carbohydrate biosynthesis protein